MISVRAHTSSTEYLSRPNPHSGSKRSQRQIILMPPPRLCRPRQYNQLTPHTSFPPIPHNQKWLGDPETPPSNNSLWRTNTARASRPNRGFTDLMELLSYTRYIHTSPLSSRTELAAPLWLFCCRHKSLFPNFPRMQQLPEFWVLRFLAILRIRVSARLRPAGTLLCVQ